MSPGPVAPPRDPIASDAHPFATARSGRQQAEHQAGHRRGAEGDAEHPRIDADFMAARQDCRAETSRKMPGASMCQRLDQSDARAPQSGRRARRRQLPAPCTRSAPGGPRGRGPRRSRIAPPSRAVCAVPRASSRFATLAQTISSTTPTAARSTRSAGRSGFDQALLQALHLESTVPAAAARSAARGGRIGAADHVRLVRGNRQRHSRPQPADHRHARRRLRRVDDDRRVEVDRTGRELERPRASRRRSSSALGRSSSGVKLALKSARNSSIVPTAPGSEW